MRTSFDDSSDCRHEIIVNSTIITNNKHDWGRKGKGKEIDERMRNESGGPKNKNNTIWM